MSDTSSYYVYTLAYPDGRVFYVGKGRGDRVYQHERDARDGRISKNCDIIRDIWAQGGQILKKRLYVNLSEEDALSIETVLIALFDRANLANGQNGQEKALALPVKVRRSQRSKSRKIIGYTQRTYEKDGLFSQISDPIYDTA